MTSNCIFSKCFTSEVVCTYVLLFDDDADDNEEQKKHVSFLKKGKKYSIMNCLQ